jgi:hypothetical protein
MEIWLPPKESEKCGKEARARAARRRGALQPNSIDRAIEQMKRKRKGNIVEGEVSRKWS